MSISISLNQLENSGLIRQAQNEPELEYIFRHALVQEAAYDSILRADRKKLHAKVGLILEKSLHTARADELLGVITYHFQQAEEWDKVLQYGRRAADQSKRMFANEEALSFYQITLSAAEKIQQMGSNDQKIQAMETAFEILSARQGVWTLLGYFDKAQSDLEEMTSIARELKNDALLADALNGLGYFYFNSSAKDPQPILREALEIKRRIGDKPGEADSLNTLASVLVSTGSAEEAMRSYKKAREIYESLGSEDGIARSNWSIGLTEYELFGHYEQARSLFERSLEICRKLGMKNLECGNLMMLGANYVRMGQIESAEATLDQAYEMAEQIGDYPAQGWIMLYQGWAMRERGQYQAAMKLTERSIHIAEERKIINLEWYGYYSLARCKILSGNPQGALPDALHIYEISRQLEIWVDVRCRATALLAEVMSLTGAEEQATSHALEALDELQRFGSLIIAESAGVYLSCYKALRKTDPQLAERVIQFALEKVNQQASLLLTEEAKKPFLESVRMNKEIISIMDNV
jgi:tetratricopeptide (TPR) repeat protein